MIASLSPDVPVAAQRWIGLQICVVYSVSSISQPPPDCLFREEKMRLDLRDLPSLETQELPIPAVKQ